MEPPKTPDEQAQLAQAIADLVEGREPSTRWITVADFFGRVGCVLRPSAVPPSDPHE